MRHTSSHQGIRTLTADECETASGGSIKTEVVLGGFKMTIEADATHSTVVVQPVTDQTCATFDVDACG